MNETICVCECKGLIFIKREREKKTKLGLKNEIHLRKKKYKDIDKIFRQT